MRSGRPREFDIDAALGIALEVFWAKGYEGASMADLTQAMGINRPSLYAAFGNKEQLFLKALDLYAGEFHSAASGFAQETTARAAIEAFLRATALLCTGPATPKGCLLVQGALAVGNASESIREELAARRAAVLDAIQQRLRQGVEEGDLPRGTDAAALARYVMVTNHGIAVQAAGGATRDELLQCVDIAMRAWPATH
ncbi:TetR/AcrR family transcriptional regulator [Streptomyces sp. NPDC002018]|uniref:TetR/AcrR family transcriptional regulator n=1 Tax=Streptomyces sp. NPDC002018 TaxID=3364629 RepID=UPI003692681C